MTFWEIFFLIVFAPFWMPMFGLGLYFLVMFVVVLPAALFMDMLRK